MTESTTAYGLRVEVPLHYVEAVSRTRDALATEGFGVLTEIDVRATLEQKLNVEFRPYIILGACNPPLAHQALTAETDIGLLLPCNVIVYEGDTPGESVVAALDPVEQLKITGNRELETVAQEVRQRMQRVLRTVAS